MGKLDKAVGYLSGAMEYAADHGIIWREKFKKLSKEAKLKIDYIDPTNKPGNIENKIGENQVYQQNLQNTGQWLDLKKYVSAYRHSDLRFVDVSDFMVVVVDPDIPQWGTSNEVILAEDQQKPILFIIEGGMSKAPRWLFDIMEIPYYHLESNVFESVEEVVEHLVAIDRGEFPMSYRWILIRKYLEALREESWWND